MKANESRKILNAQKKLQKKLIQFVTIMGVEAKNHFVKSFKNQGFEDETVQRWEPRRMNDRGRKGNRAILVKSGDLRRSIRVIKKNINSVTLGSDLPYAQIHNDGLYGRAWGKHRFKMPKRQFVGHSRKLIMKLRGDLDKKVHDTFK